MRGNISYLSSLLKNREISCKELTTKYLEKIDKANKTLNAYITVTAEEALKTAEAVDNKLSKGKDISNLAGIPMSLKDNISTKGIRTTCSSKMLSNYTPIYDATVWSILKNNGAVLLGKTNMDEFAMGSSCENSYFGATLNPHNLNYVPGGSSGGSACAVSAGLSVYSLGSDTGGSIRQPASFCGAVGLKPTYGAVSRYGLIAYASSFDQIGPICSSVEDTAIVYDAISLYDEKDSTSKGKKRNVSDCLKKNIKGIKIGIIKEYLDGLSDVVYTVFKETCKAYESLGCEIVELSIPSLNFALPVYYILACAEASSNLGRFDGIRYGHKTDSYNSLYEMICKTRSEGFGKEVKNRILLGTYVLSAGYFDAYYKKAQNLRSHIIKNMNTAFEKCDIILAPTVATPAFERFKAENDPVATYLTDLYTVPVNIAGFPAISIPCGESKEGLPIGMQLIGNHFCEDLILNVAFKYENATSNNKALKWGAQL